MALPMANVGPGSPDLELRAAAHLLATYTQASCSRSPTAQAAASFLASVHCPGGERQRLSLGASLLEVQLAVLPYPLVANLEISTDVSLHALAAHTHLLLSTDGALRGQDAGGGIVLATPAGAIVLRAWFGMRAWATPTDVEWLTRLVAFYLLRDWSGTLLCALDAAATLFRAFTVSPPRYTVLEVIWRALAPTFLRLRPLHEVWSPAQCDTHATHLLAHLNAAAHTLATTSARCPQAWAAPLSALLGTRLLLYHRGALMLDPHSGLDAAYDVATADKYYAGPHSTLLRPSAAHFQRLLETAELPTLAIKRAYAYRIFEWQSPPDRHVPMEFQFCGVVWRDLHRHVRGRCPTAFARLQHARALFFSHGPWELWTHVQVDGWLCKPSGRRQHRCTWDGLHHHADAPRGVLITLSGLVYGDTGCGSAPLPPTACKRIIQRVVGALADPVPGPTAVLALWAALNYTIRLLTRIWRRPASRWMYTSTASTSTNLGRSA